MSATLHWSQGDSDVRGAGERSVDRLQDDVAALQFDQGRLGSQLLNVWAPGAFGGW